jgi:hypothetical protein
METPLCSDLHPGGSAAQPAPILSSVAMATLVALVALIGALRHLGWRRS